MWECPQCGRRFKKINQSHYCTKRPVTVDEYILSQPEAIQKYLTEMRKVLKEALPEAEEKIAWGMPTYWQGHNLIHFAASKNHIGLYPGKTAVQVFSDQLKDFSIHQGTIRLPYDQPLPLALIAKIARWCYETREN